MSAQDHDSVDLTSCFLLQSQRIRSPHTFRRDPTWHNSRFHRCADTLMPEGFWTGAEQFLGIICPTLPTLHPLIKLAWERSTSGSSGRTPTSESDKVRGKNDFIRKQRSDKELLRKPEIGTTTPPPHDVAMEVSGPKIYRI